jgi:hypothetical protein
MLHNQFFEMAAPTSRADAVDQRGPSTPFVPRGDERDAAESSRNSRMTSVDWMQGSQAAEAIKTDKASRMDAGMVPRRAGEQDAFRGKGGSCDTPGTLYKSEWRALRLGSKV